jgi:hypothetical protein
MARFGICGPSYASQSLNADAQTCENFYLEAIESGQGKSAFALYQCPGRKLFTSLAGMANVRTFGFYTLASGARWFAIAEDAVNQWLWEIFVDGTKQSWGKLGAAGAQATMAANNANQLMAASGGRLFKLNLLTNNLVEIDSTSGAALQGAVASVGFSDGYFVALLSNSQKFQISNLLDGGTWNPANIAQVSLYPDNVLSMVIDHREIVLMGSKATVVYYNSGDPLFPFVPTTGGFIEQGTAGISPPVLLDNSIFWVGGDERGSLIGWRANGYTPTRVSNHAIEYAWQSYATTSDLESYSYQDQGHAFWVVRFPTAQKTWVYDVATGQWHERSSLVNGVKNADRARCHTFAFGKHYVGDAFSGNIYQQSIAFYDDAGTPIRRVRRAPHISSEQQWIFHSQLQLDIEVGVGVPLFDGQGQPRGPQVMLRWSDDGGKTWSNEHPESFGQVGHFRKRVVWRRMGRSRDRIYEVSISDPVPARFVDAYLDASPGFKVPSERLSKQLSKIQ